MTTSLDDRIDRLSTLSLKRILEPDEHVLGSIGEGQLLPDWLLSTAGLDLGLTPEQKVILSREEVASIAATGVRFEAVLMAGFGIYLVQKSDLIDPRVTYVLHELGEETRHSRLFVRMLEQLHPTSVDPIPAWLQFLLQKVGLPLLMMMPALFCVLVLSGEEIPDLFQRLAVEDPATDPFIREVNRYHRAEEARHLAFGRMILPEMWADAGPIQRWIVRRVGPVIVTGMFDTLVHPGVYAAVGLPTWPTWQKVRRTPNRVSLRHDSLRPLVAAMSEAGVFRAGRISKPWRKAAGVDRFGQPVAA